MDFEPPDPVAVGLREPEVAVRAGRDPDGGAASGDAGAVFGHDARRRHPPDSVVLSANQRFPSRPVVIPRGELFLLRPALYSVTMPAGVIFPTLLPPYSVNQTLPSGPAVRSERPLSAVPAAPYSVTTPAGVIFPILPSCSVNQTLPSGPAAFP